MSRYIDADALQRRICGAKCGCEYEDCGCEGDCAFEHFIFHAPTADVAPRAEVASEILEEIESIINKAIYDWRNERKFAYNDRQIEMIDFRNGAFRFLLHEIAELKIKFTQER